MTITRDTVYELLHGHLHPEDHANLPRLTDLAYLAILIHTIALICPTEERDTAKAGLIDLLSESSIRTICEEVTAGRLFPCTDEHINQIVGNLKMSRSLVDKLVEESPTVTKSALISWISDAWNNGVTRKQVHDGEREGGITDDEQIVINFGCSLCLFGSRKGLLPTNPTDSSPS